jgi:hypothetical protein
VEHIIAVVGGCVIRPRQRDSGVQPGN